MRTVGLFSARKVSKESVLLAVCNLYGASTPRPACARATLPQKSSLAFQRPDPPQPVEIRNLDPVVNVFSAGVPMPLPLDCGRPINPPDIDNETGLILPPPLSRPLAVLMEERVGGSVSESPMPKDD